MIDTRKKCPCCGQYILPNGNEEVENIKKLYQEVCEIWGIKIEWLRGRGRKEDKPIMKKILWMLAEKKYPFVPYRILGILSGNKDHSGVIKGIEVANNWLSVKDEKFMNYYNQVKYLIEYDTNNR
jgi:chromosomal replication initiation ATPase DnaA